MNSPSRFKNHFQASDFKDKQSLSQSHSSFRSHATKQQHLEQTNNPKSKQYLFNLPECPYHHKPIRYLCVNPKCKASNYGLCSEEQCKNYHESPVIDLIELTKFNELIITNTSSLLSVLERSDSYLKEMRDKLVHKLEMDIQKSKYLLENAYLNPVLQLIKEKKFRQIDSTMLHTFLNRQIIEVNPSLRNKMEVLKHEVIQRIQSKEKIFKKFMEKSQYSEMLLLDLFQGNNTFGQYMNGLDLKNFNSKIFTFKEEFQSLCKMIKSNKVPVFKEFQLVFRASEHNFSASQFHKYSDNKQPLLIAIKTDKNKKFGAYLNCKINSKSQWVCDSTGLSFIFSLDHNESYPLKSDANCRIKTAFGGSEGPQIGMGCDIYIVDKCNTNKKSGSNFGGSYRLPNNLQFSSARSRSYLAGEETFLVVEYEVFHLV